MVDEVAEWQGAYARVRRLVAGLSGEQLETHVPACPDWTVRDLVSHMVGLGSDVLMGDEPDDHGPNWTERQVHLRRDRSAAELLEEWAVVAARLSGWMRVNGTRPLNDVVIHEQDLRGAVGVAGARDDASLVVVRERMLARLARGVGELPPLAFSATDSHWRRVCREGRVEEGEADVRLEASGFDLFRALTSRRTAGELRRYAAAGDVTPYLDAFAGLGALPTEPLPE